MALKNLSSLFDLVGGNQPVGDMSTQQGAQSFDLGPDSVLQQNSLPEIPIDSPYQDLEGNPGPQFDLGNSSTLQQDSLLNIPTAPPSINSFGYYWQNQNLKGEPGPQFDLGRDSKLQHDSLPLIPINSDYQDLDNADGGNGFFHGTNNPGVGQGLQLDGMDLHEKLLNSNYSYQHGDSQANIQAGGFDLNGTSPSQYIDNLPE